MKSTGMVLVFLGLFAVIGRAEAKCESLLGGLDSMNGDQLVAQYKKVVSCDTKVANQVFSQFMLASQDAESLVALSLVAIDTDIWNPVWGMINKLTSYEARDVVSSRVGMSCVNHPKVVGFLQGAYYGLRDIEFSQWDDALVSCESKDLQDWLIQQVEDPPAKLYDEKWSALADAMVQRDHAAALTHLAKGALVAAKKGGPFEAILMKMEAAVAPDLGDNMSPEDRASLEESLVGLARQLPPDMARSIADRLANSGSDARAADLLPNVYPDQKKGGVYTYGAATVEAGECGGQKQAVIHFAEVEEPGKRWIILPAVEESFRAMKPRLSKCESVRPWPVLVSPEPSTNPAAIATWVQSIVKDWEQQGYAVKTREEKAINLQ